ncbi:MAG: DUF4177 domain-containing protein [Candidatus Eisenbacteria bacterium]|uniref:DUF4177 domain-containing protein n=1 Tax=Eiseniibacteriota bacterium TaxID=2212470 RepID=A0A933SF22_UNCEI|nr:DUF4177 domain-containing protein [Candidatus Eisenbacteria bacterium]
MRYDVVPFTANIIAGQGAKAAASQLADIINQHAADGWEYVRLESVQTLVTTPGIEGSAGCMGFGARPGVPDSEDVRFVYMIVFRKPA